MKTAFQIPDKRVTKYEWQKSIPHYLAVGSDFVNIYDRKGEIVNTIKLQGGCKQLRWNPKGFPLVILQDKTTDIVTWSPDRGAVFSDSGLKYLDFIEWNMDGSYYAVAGNKAILIVNEITGKKIPILGKHSKTITGIQWISQDRLASCSSDKTVIISNSEGDSIHQTTLKAETSMLKWNQNAGKHGVLSVVVDKRSIVIFSGDDLDRPTQFDMKAKNGNIVDYHWTLEDNIVIAFENGTIMILSTSPSRLGEEIFAGKIFKEALVSFDVSESLGKIVACGDNTIKLHELSNIHDVTDVLTFTDDHCTPFGVSFSNDGQFLTVMMKEQILKTFISKSPILNHVWNNRIVCLKDLNAIVVQDYSDKPSWASMEVNFEPKFVSSGPVYVCVGQLNNCHFFRVNPESKVNQDHMEYLYPSRIINNTAISFTGEEKTKKYDNELVTVLTNATICVALFKTGKIYVHQINELFFTEETDSIIIEENNFKIIQVQLTTNHIIYCTDNGKIVHYDLDELTEVLSFQHKAPVKYFSCKPEIGNLIAFVDDKDNGYVYLPLEEECCEIQNWEKDSIGILWGNVNSWNFISWTKSKIHLYAVVPYNLSGPISFKLNFTPTTIAIGSQPLIFENGKVQYQSGGGAIYDLDLIAYRKFNVEEILEKYPIEMDQGRLLRQIHYSGKLDRVWELHPGISSEKAWLMLAEALIKQLEIAPAKRIYRDILKDAGMTMNLDRIEMCEDVSEIKGHVYVLLGDFAQAEICFLDSNNPIEAMIMRMDLLEWESALKIATSLAPEKISQIALEYGSQLEMEGRTGEAHAQYSSAMATSKSFVGTQAEISEHRWLCHAGLCRTSFALGDITQGMTLLNGVSNKFLIEECVTTLENMKQFYEAGMLLERVGSFDRAAKCWVKVKNWKKLASIFDQVNNPATLKEIGQAKEQEKLFAEAATAYEKAQDYDSVINILIEHLDNLDGGAELIRKTNARESAKRVAKLYIQKRQFKEAIEFYMIAGMQTVAFDLAVQYDLMNCFSNLVKDDATAELLSEIAEFYEKKNNYLEAGKHFLWAGQYQQALRFLLQCNPDTGSVDFAIAAIGEAKNDNLTHLLIDYLMGEKDGIPKDAKYIFKLYMSLGQYREASRTAIIIAREEQSLGNYKIAHDLLFENYQQLKHANIPIPSELSQMLILLHSYTLVKLLVKTGDHLRAARMLVRVSNNVSKFPAHVVPILTSTVIECYKAGLKAEAYNFAVLLMRPEYRSQLDQKFKKKIELIVRRPDKEVSPETQSACPYCNAMVDDTTLTCNECKSILPFCIASGQHMVVEEWSQCPNCKFPAISSCLKLMTEHLGVCPMCSCALDLDQIVILKNPLKSVAEVEKKKTANEEPPSIVGAELIGGLAR